MNNAIADLMSGLGSSDQATSWKNTLKFFEQFGFHIVNYGMIDKAHNELLGFHTNMTDEWMAYYMEQEFCHDDPWANYVIDNAKPILYAKEGPSELIIPEGSRSEFILNEMGGVGLRTSICVPIHNKYGHLITGFNLVSRANHEEFDAMLAENLDDILLGVALINNELVEASVQEIDSNSWFPNPNFKHVLTIREVEVLKWLCEGHRNERIAEKMNIAPVTVNYHLQEIRRKLGANTREQAVAMGFKQGILR